MIVARICKPKGGDALVTVGSVRVVPYDGKKDGWFPLDSFNFGFLEHKDEANAAPAAKGAPAKGGTGTHSTVPTAPAGGKGDKGEKKDRAEMSLSKQVDSVSSSLLFLAMQERKSKKGTSREKELQLEADIHVVSSLQAGAEGDRSTYTSLMVHLEAVNVVDWQLSASGDSRPTETVKLRYDRVAMIYIATADGKVFRVDPPKGWDQTENKPFEWDTSLIEKYYPPSQATIFNPA
jgi:type VI protein secretion system component Hcp